MKNIIITDNFYKISGGFTIARGRIDVVHVIQVMVTDGTYCGYGECRPYSRYGETADSVKHAIQSIVPDIVSHLPDAMRAKNHLQNILPAGAARNAVDCALWDLMIKQMGTDIFTYLDIQPCEKLPTLYTISMGTPEKMANDAQNAVNMGAKTLKIKLAGNGDDARLKTLRCALPDTPLMLDMNEAWNKNDYINALPMLLKYNILFIEQPLHADNDTDLHDIPKNIDLYADESFHDSQSLHHVQGLYQGVNIKLDKTGGLTQALECVRLCREENLKIMVGCMLSSSLSIAPAFILASMGVVYCDLDAPALLSQDRSPAMKYENGYIYAPESALWG